MLVSKTNGDLHMPDSQFELDHVVINVRADIDEAAEIFAQLGFAITPKG